MCVTFLLLPGIKKGLNEKVNEKLDRLNPSRPNPGSTPKKCKNKKLTYFLFQYNFQKCTKRKGLSSDESTTLILSTLERSPIGLVMMINVNQ